MSKPLLYTGPTDNITNLTDTLSLCEYQNPKNGNFGFWLYDSTRGMNLSMRATSEQEAFVKALTYYQRRLTEVESELSDLTQKVNQFVSQFTLRGEDDGRIQLRN